MTEGEIDKLSLEVAGIRREGGRHVSMAWSVLKTNVTGSDLFDMFQFVGVSPFFEVPKVYVQLPKGQVRVGSSDL